MFSSSLKEQNPEEGGTVFAHLAQEYYLTCSFLFRALHVDSWVRSVPALVGDHFVCATRSLHSKLFIRPFFLAVRCEVGWPARCSLVVGVRLFCMEPHQGWFIGSYMEPNNPSQIHVPSSC